MQVREVMSRDVLVTSPVWNSRCRYLLYAPHEGVTHAARNFWGMDNLVRIPINDAFVDVSL